MYILLQDLQGKDSQISHGFLECKLPLSTHLWIGICTPQGVGVVTRVFNKHLGKQHTLTTKVVFVRSIPLHILQDVKISKSRIQKNLLGRNWIYSRWIYQMFQYLHSSISKFLCFSKAFTLQSLSFYFFFNAILKAKAWRKTFIEYSRQQPHQ